MKRLSLCQESIWRYGARFGIALVPLVAFLLGYLFCLATTRADASPLYTTSTSSCCTIPE
ncbi:MAG: hypothetical protein WC655_26245 [Candidatus Hydrogenedentales bacterium]|jgi:hypothetical protein